MKFWIFVIFNETFLEQSIWICKWVSWWCCHRITVSMYFIYKISTTTKIKFLAQTCKSIIPISKYIRANITLPLSRVYIRQFFFLLSHSTWDFVISVNKIHGKLWGDDIIISLSSALFILTVQEMFRWKLRNFQIHIFLIFYPIYIKFSLFCSKYAVKKFKVQRSLAPLSRFRGSHIPSAHEQQCCRFQSYANSVRSPMKFTSEIDIAWTTFLGSTTTDHVITSCDVGL